MSSFWMKLRCKYCMNDGVGGGGGGGGDVKQTNKRIFSITEMICNTIQKWMRAPLKAVEWITCNKMNSYSISQ